jgi:hypothetical protein
MKTADSRQQAANSKQQRADSRQQTAGSKQQTADSRQQTKMNLRTITQSLSAGTTPGAAWKPAVQFSN